MLMNPKGRRAAIGAAIAIVLIAAGVALYVLFGRAETVELSSAWPFAESERKVPKPEAPPVWPLTGLPAPSADAPTKTRTVSVKIENSPQARPQSGLQSADVVYESITEGGITRFNCMFSSTDPGEVGPVRSARLSDIYIVPQYDALFVFSGASGLVNAAVKKAGLQNLSQDVGVTYGYRRSSERAAPHNLYVTLSEIREEGVKRGYPATQQIRSLQFARSAEGTPSVSKITIPFSTANTSRWEWDSSADVYKRFNNGKVHSDALTGEQITAKNVVVLWARMDATAKRDVAGSTTYDIVLTGSNRATVFRNGQRFDGTWSATADSPPVFKATDGTAIRLAPGNTWFQVIPSDVNITME